MAKKIKKCFEGGNQEGWKYEVKAGTLGGEPVPKPLWWYLPNPKDFACLF